MDWILITYIVYIICSLFFTLWVGHNLYRNGQAYVEMVFRDIQIAHAINKLLLIGFYLVNIAYMLLVLKEKQEVINFQQTLEVLSIKLGLIVVILAGMHFFNLIALYEMKRRKLFIQ